MNLVHAVVVLNISGAAVCWFNNSFEPKHLAQSASKFMTKSIGRDNYSTKRLEASNFPIHNPTVTSIYPNVWPIRSRSRRINKVNEF
jgi:hypothetical protein